MSSVKKMVRFQFLDFANRVTIRTFNKDIYILRPGLIVQNVETNQYRRIEEIYYEIRTVRTIKGAIIAKRKNKNSELYMAKAKVAS
ncbi:hypothetical protein ACO0DA_10410 [Bacillus subtilis]|uniref:hypothetical protein n=1 Tax=Bacillus TaxID=1386 RepID=UPI00057C31BD|nr:MULTISPECIES: hypothetical protein [Bacillus]MCY7883127.1 hypothetical protein [Bacillus spizizenii]MCY8635279.1 hypothetical protein [Bacillus spizizenii]MCY9397621.1 hypothetical protein [Bacillus inaquosorum]MEC0400832.1 hypothetical protein [Bacillus subtilis]QAW06602.1 hypothetical protein ES968_21800 [Bacillus subtilis]